MSLDESAFVIPVPAAVPYLAIGDGRAQEAIDWYGRVFGATVNGDPYVEGGRIGHAELQIGSGVVYISDEAPDYGAIGPSSAGASVSLMLPVDNADTTRAAALAAGATSDREPFDAYGQRNAWLVDPFHHRWCLTSRVRPTQ